ncbi:MAG: nucleoside hydrolase [Sciscionella sp.]
MPSLIIDTDPGVDDAFAIALGALAPDVDLLAVTTVYGNVSLPATTTNALRLLALCNRHEVPVAAGAARPLVHPQPHLAGYVHGADGLSGQAGSLPRSRRRAVETGAVALLARLLAEADEPVTIAAIGPLTNIALLLAIHPELAGKIERLVVMGGAVTGGNVTAAAEFNIWSDPEAARRVLVEERVPVTLVPMDLTYRCAVDTAWLSRLDGSGPVGKALHALTPTYLQHYRKALGWDGIVLHDAVAVAEALWPGLLRTETMRVEVECAFGPSRGATVLDRRRQRLRDTTPADTSSPDESPRPIQVALDADIDALLPRILTTLRSR